MQADADAFTAIIERYKRAVYAVAFSTVRDRALADDITQDTFVIAWRRLGELRDDSRLGAWLCGIARNLARDARKRRHRETPTDAVAEPVFTTTPYEAMSEAETERVVQAALGQVPDVYRESLVLYYYEERSIDDVARSLGISTATTNKRLSRGRQYLASCVAAVERGLTRRGPSPQLAASVLVVIGLTLPASHVDASPAPVKGSTMHKLALAALVGTAAVGGAALVIAVRSDAAHAQPHSTTTVATTEASKPADSSFCLTDAMRAIANSAKQGSAHREPSLRTGALALENNDCTAVGRHLAELEADVTYGPANRPDDATCEKCATHYKTQCEVDKWPVERRSCALAAADLINAHLCAGGAPATQPPAQVPANLSCATLATHLATTIQGAGLHADVTDMPQQIEAACDLGNWTIELRQCFAGASNIPALQACIMPDAAH